MRIAHVSTFAPLRCGIASFAGDLIDSIVQAEHRRYVLHYGSLTTPDAWGEADVTSPIQVAQLAKAISSSDCDLVSLQHEFGIWGGGEGEHLNVFLQHLEKPLISVLHTTFGPGARSNVQRELIATLVDRSDRVVVLTESAKSTVETLLDRRIRKLVVIPHGIHGTTYVEPPERLGHQEPFRLITPGYFREDKGIETVLVALWRLIRRGFAIAYTVAGEPQRQFGRQADYLSDLRALIEKLGLESAVSFDIRYLSLQEQVVAIQAAHAGIFAYQDVAQSSSGTVPLVLAAGRPAICTPFEFARAKAVEGPGLFLSSGFGSGAVADAIAAVIDAPDCREISRAIHSRAGEWTWPRIGQQYLARYEDVIREAISSTANIGRSL